MDSTGRETRYRTLHRAFITIRKAPIGDGLSQTFSMETDAITVVALGAADEIRELQRAFAARGWTLLVAKTAAEARTLVLDRTANVLLVQFSDPSFGGQDALELIQTVKSYATIPVIVASDSHRESSILRTLSVEVDALILDALGPEDLVQRIEIYIEKHFHEEGSRGGDRRVVRSRLVDLDIVRHKVSVMDKPAQLTEVEFQVLALFMEHANSLLTPEYIRQMLERRGFSVTRPEAHRRVLELDQQLRSLASPVTFFVFVSGAGYIFTGGIHLPPGH